MAISEEFILANIKEFEVISISSNKIYRFRQGEDKYILKVNNIPPCDLSPFWWGIKEVFGSDFEAQRENIEETLSMLNNPHIQVAQFVDKNHKHKFQLFKEVEGLSYEPDEFPDSNAIERQLGQFIGFIHSTHYDYFGHQKLHFRSDFKEKMLSTMLQAIQRHWSDSHAVKMMFEKISRLSISPASYSLIMPDISANQFIFGEGLASIKAVVDFDAYVIGPREWELSVIEMCLKDGRAFKEGYEQYNPLPDINEHREFYRFFMYLSDILEKPDLDSFMRRNILF